MILKQLLGLGGRVGKKFRTKGKSERLGVLSFGWNEGGRGEV